MINCSLKIVTVKIDLYYLILVFCMLKVIWVDLEKLSEQIGTVFTYFYEAYWKLIFKENAEKSINIFNRQNFRFTRYYFNIIHTADFVIITCH